MDTFTCKLQSACELLRLTPTDKTRIEKGWYGWWVMGCVEGDRSIPGSEMFHSAYGALDNFIKFYSQWC
jgi:hypothetical protein